MEVRYGSLKRTHSAKSIGGMGSRSSSRNNSFVDLPLIAMPGIGSRVSINNVTSESQLDLQELFKHGEPIHIEAVTVEGGWTCPLVFSMLGALLSSLCFGYNNANMNTQASIMRDALGIPSALPDDCVPPGTPHSLPANDALWGFVVSGFCLSALLGSGGAGRIADRHGRRVFLLANSLLYILAGLAEGAHAEASHEGGAGWVYRASEFRLHSRAPMPFPSYLGDDDQFFLRRLTARCRSRTAPR